MNDGSNETNVCIIPNDWSEVPNWKFTNDKTFTSVVIPDNIISIGKCAFAHCWKLKKIDIGKNVENICKYAFRKDNRPNEMLPITEVINRSITPQIINKYHFHNNDLKKAVLYVPQESVEVYRNADGWKEFGRIAPIPAVTDSQLPTPDFTIPNPDTQLSTYIFQDTAHLWLCNFASDDEIDEYANNTEYEWEYYGHLLGEDNFDEPPDEAGLCCAFCFEYGIMYEEAADISDDIIWKRFENEMPVEKILNYLNPFPVKINESLSACEKKYPELKNANSYIVVFGWREKQSIFEKTKSNRNCFYLGEFEMPQDDGNDHP